MDIDKRPDRLDGFPFCIGGAARIRYDFCSSCGSDNCEFLLLKNTVSAVHYWHCRRCDNYYNFEQITSDD